MRFTASCAATWGSALAKRGSHSHGPTTPTRNQAACPGLARKPRQRRRRMNLWRPQRIMENKERNTGGRGEWCRAGEEEWRGGAKAPGSGAASTSEGNTPLIAFLPWPSGAPNSLEEAGLKGLDPWKNRRLGESEGQLYCWSCCSVRVKNSSTVVHTGPNVSI